MGMLFDTTNVFNYESNLDAMPYPWCEYLIDGRCPCIAMCVFTELWRDCCGCERCCFCGM